MNTAKLRCPVCMNRIVQDNNILTCSNHHCFDIASEGYVNLLSGKHKSGNLVGDNKSMARSRRNFLNKNYYYALASFLSEYVKNNNFQDIIDICCGEGYYGRKILADNNINLYGFDLSKEMIRLAAKSKMNATLFVANLSSIPVEDDSFDLALNMFAPFNEEEYSRILKKSGKLLYVVPGENHLFNLKEIVYDNPYKNEEKIPDFTKLSRCNVYRVKDVIGLDNNEDIMELFSMTPYCYHTSPADKEKLLKCNSLKTEIDFLIIEYIKNDG